MKTLSYLLSVVLVLFTIGISSAGQFGPAKPAAKEGGASIGIGYFNSESKMKSSETGNLIFKSNQVHLQGSYSFVKNWEAYGRIGVADMKERVLGLKDGAKVFGSLGVRGLLYDDGLFSFGPFIQGNMYSTYSDTVTSSASVCPRAQGTAESVDTLFRTIRWSCTEKQTLAAFNHTLDSKIFTHDRDF